MTRYDRKKMIEGIILNGRQHCTKCEKDVTDGFTNIDDILDTVETRKINNMLPKSARNCTVVHIDCIKALGIKIDEESHIDKVLAILTKGPTGGWQQCFECKNDLTGMNMEELETLVIHRPKNNTAERLVHKECAR